MYVWHLGAHRCAFEASCVWASLQHTSKCIFVCVYVCSRVSLLMYLHVYMSVCVYACLVCLDACACVFMRFYVCVCRKMFGVFGCRLMYLLVCLRMNVCGYKSL